jgi:hypothetical protein
MQVPMMLAAAGGLMAVGQLASGQAESNAARFNQQIAGQNAEITRQQTEADIAQLRRGAFKQRGGLRAAVGASGITLEGSALDVLEESSYQAERDVQRRKYQGELQARGFQNDAALYGAQSRAARTTGFLGAASSVLLGAASYRSATRPGTPIRV